eukprot:gene18187-5760_t
MAASALDEKLGRASLVSEDRIRKTKPPTSKGASGLAKYINPQNTDEVLHKAYQSALALCGCGDGIQDATADANGVAEQALSLIRIVRCFASEPFETDRYKNWNRKM